MIQEAFEYHKWTIFQGRTRWQHFASATTTAFTISLYTYNDFFRLCSSLPSNGNPTLPRTTQYFRYSSRYQITIMSHYTIGVTPSESYIDAEAECQESSPMAYDSDAKLTRRQMMIEEKWLYFTIIYQMMVLTHTRHFIIIYYCYLGSIEYEPALHVPACRKFSAVMPLQSNISCTA